MPYITKHALIWYLAWEFYCQVLRKGEIYGQNTVLRLVSKHYILHLKIFINLRMKLRQCSYLRDFQGKIDAIRKEGTASKGRDDCEPWLCLCICGDQKHRAVIPPNLHLATQEPEAQLHLVCSPNTQFLAAIKELKSVARAATWLSWLKWLLC